MLWHHIWLAWRLPLFVACLFAAVLVLLPYEGHSWQPFLPRSPGEHQRIFERHLARREKRASAHMCRLDPSREPVTQHRCLDCVWQVLTPTGRPTGHRPCRLPGPLDLQRPHRRICHRRRTATTAIRTSASTLRRPLRGIGRRRRHPHQTREPTSPSSPQPSSPSPSSSSVRSSRSPLSKLRSTRSNLRSSPHRSCWGIR